MIVRRLRPCWLPLGLALGLALLPACIELPDFPRANLVDQPRVLAIVADPPEARPGQSVELSLMLSHEVDASDVEWIVCGEYFSFSGGNQYGDGESGEGCGDDDLHFGRGARATLPGALTATLFANLELARDVLGDSLPEATIELVRTRVGLPLLIEARFEHAGRTIRATKRVLVSERPRGNTNPPPPSFMLGAEAITVLDDPARPFECASGSGEAPMVEPGAKITLTPAGGGKAEPWLERYQVIDARGELQDRIETAFYSWYATGGELTPRVSKQPDRTATWETPSEPNCHRMWLIVRDGHGGTSACFVDIAVAEQDACSVESAF